MATNATKLGLPAGGMLAVRGLPRAEAAAVVGELPEGARTRALGGGGADQDATAGGGEDRDADVVVLFADDVAAVHAEVATAKQAVTEGGRLWVAYRKGAGRDALNRDTLQRALADHGLVGVFLVSLDPSWSAMRVRDLRPGEPPPAR